jgi:Bacterial protein of unknown function (DUF922)
VHEREAPEATVAPPAPVDAPAPAAPAGLAGMPAVALSLQRSLGNRLVSRALASIARDEVVDEVALDEEAIPLDDGKPAPPAAPTPAFDHSGGQTVTINANSAVEFSQNIVDAIGAPHVAPEFTPDIAFDTVGKTRKITSIGLSVKTSIVKVRFGMGRVDDENRAMIATMVQEIQAHEQRHRKIIEDAATKALADAQKLVGTSQVEAAQKALSTTVECTANKGHEALDATEGKLTVSEVRQPDGKITLTLSKSGSGAKYPCAK